VVDGGKGIVLGARAISHHDMDDKNNGISPGLNFEILLEFKVWIKEFFDKHHCLYTVVHLDVKEALHG
jgi:hypothetical protein